MTNQYEVAGEPGILSPSLIFYKDLILENTQKILSMANGPDRLWPHVKSHKMMDFVHLMQSFGIRRFKCATIAEAQMLAEAKVADVLLAYPLVGPSIQRFLALSARSPSSIFWAIGDDMDQIRILGEKAVENDRSVPLLVDVNMGMDRTGVPILELKEFASKCNFLKGIEFMGFHCYDGNHHEGSFEERCAAVEKTDAQVVAIQEELLASGLNCSTMVMGGSPSFPCHARHPDFFLSPGTIFINDDGYRQAFPDLDCVPAAAILCRVISHPAKGRFTLDLGYKAIASDPPDLRGVIQNLDHVRSVFQNEEHWVFAMEAGYEEALPPIGKVLYVVPTHICPTSALYPYALIAEHGQLVERWNVTARNRYISV